MTLNPERKKTFLGSLMLQHIMNCMKENFGSDKKHNSLWYHMSCILKLLISLCVGVDGVIAYLGVGTISTKLCKSEGVEETQGTSHLLHSP